MSVVVLVDSPSPAVASSSSSSSSPLFIEGQKKAQKSNDMMLIWALVGVTLFAIVLFVVLYLVYYYYVQPPNNPHTVFAKQVSV
jgi:heme/copper-type cytochrome/quinol oxidase subunit 2